MYGNFNSFNPNFNPQYSAQIAQMAQQRLNQYHPNDIQFVNGRESAEMYQMVPNSKAILMDSNMARFYIKETDASGMARVTAYDFKEATDAPSVEYVTRNEFEELKKNYESIIEKLSVNFGSGLNQEHITTTSTTESGADGELGANL